jgi:hypothetical protein
MASSMISSTFPIHLLEIAATILDATASRALQWLERKFRLRRQLSIVGGAYDWYVFVTIGADEPIDNIRLEALLNLLSIGVYSRKIVHFL